MASLTRSKCLKFQILYVRQDGDTVRKNRVCLQSHSLADQEYSMTFQK